MNSIFNKNKESEQKPIEKQESIEKEIIIADQKESEQKREKEMTEYREAVEKEIKEATIKKAQPVLKAKQAKVVAKHKGRNLVAIEQILEEDLGQVFFSLPDNLKKEFKIKGEETAIQIDKLLKKTKIKVKEVVKLIVNWLKIIPGVSKYFIEQEAKIKTDKILKLK